MPEDRDGEPVQHFGGHTGDLHRLADWLSVCDVDTVAMESTGVYWIPLYEILEARDFEVLLANAQHVKNVPGRKTDVLDCQWLLELHTYGLLRGSFRPVAEIAAVRSLVRHRDKLVQQCAACVQRMQKAMVLMNVQLHTVITNITGKTGMSIIRDIVAGQIDPTQLARHRDRRCRATEEEITAALTGHYRHRHVTLVDGQAFHVLADTSASLRRKAVQSRTVASRSAVLLRRSHSAAAMFPPRACRCGRPGTLGVTLSYATKH